MHYGNPRAARTLRERPAARIAAAQTFFALLLLATSTTWLLQPASAQTQSQNATDQQQTSQQQQQATPPPRKDEHAGHQMPAEPMPQATATGPSLQLADLERMALEANPTLGQADAAVRAAEGRRVQAGLWPNPIIGYQGSEFSTRAFNDKSEHLAFIEQSILLGGKLAKSRSVFAQEKLQAEQDTVAQKQRILNAVRVLYYEALGAQQLVEVRGELAKLARNAVGITEELFNVGQADRPDALEISIEAERAQLDLIMAENERDQVWQQLGAVLGNPFLKPARLEGSLEKGLPVLDREAMLATLLRDSPEIKRAQAGVERAKAVITRAKAEPVPDLFVRGGFGYSTEPLDARNARFPGQKTGPEASIEVGVRIPLFNRNQGNIAAASAELDIAEREARRQELVLRARMASAFKSYQNALRVATQYERQIIPHAQRAYDLYITNFRQMAAAYPQALIAQRTLFQVRADYVRALVDVWQNATQIRGLLLTGGLDAPIGARIEGAGEPGGESGFGPEHRHGASQSNNRER